jgi:hypothetical protein
MTDRQFESFEEFWPFYVGEHSQASTRTFHFIGTSFGLISLVMLFITGKIWFLPLGLIVSYGFAWFSHFFIEKNRPATFKYPLYSFLADFRMYSLMLKGQMDAEVLKVTSKAI